MNWNAIIALCTGAAAIFTAVMAGYTRAAIRNGQQQFRDASARSEHHHQDAFRPIVVLSPYDGVDPLEDRSYLVGFSQTAVVNDWRVCTIQCALHNVGIGPALNVRLQYRAMGRSSYGLSRELTPLRAGEQRGSPKNPFYVHFRATADFNDTDIAFASGTGWELAIEYEDVFGNVFHTIHRKNPQMPWTECGKGPAPIKRT